MLKSRDFQFVNLVITLIAALMALDRVFYSVFLRLLFTK